MIRDDPITLPTHDLAVELALRLDREWRWQPLAAQLRIFLRAAPPTLIESARTTQGAS